MEAHRGETFKQGVASICQYCWPWPQALVALETATTLLASVWEVRTQGKQQLPRWERHTNEYGESWLPGKENQKWKPLQEPGRGEENLNCNWQIAGGLVWTILRVKNSRGPSPRGAPAVLWDLPPGAWLDSHNKHQRKIPLCFRKEKEKRNLFF